MSAFTDYIDKLFNQLSKTKRFRRFVAGDELEPIDKVNAVLVHVIVNDIPSKSGSRLGGAQKLAALFIADTIGIDGVSGKTLTELAASCEIARRTVISGVKKIRNIPKLRGLKVSIADDRVSLIPLKD